MQNHELKLAVDVKGRERGEGRRRRIPSSTEVSSARARPIGKGRWVGVGAWGGSWSHQLAHGAASRETRRVAGFEEEKGADLDKDEEGRRSSATRKKRMAHRRP